MKLSIIVPCYNEEKAIPNLISQLEPAVKELKKNYAVELVFVDDGSADRTYELLQQKYGKRKDAKIVRHRKNYNLGGALRSGFKFSTGDVIIPLDCDCTFPPSKISELVSLLDERTDIVNASPYHPLGRLDNVPLYRRFLSKSVIHIYRFLMGKKQIYTYTVMVRAYRRKVIENVKFKSNDFLASSELLVYALLRGYKVKDYPTTLYTRQYGESSIKLARVIASHMGFILKLIEIKLFGMPKEQKNHK